jgi:NADPH:quinone reductase-like Zn-dependent oxidoreductase
MKAVVYDAYGSPDVLRLMEVPTPQPKPDEVLIRTRASTVTSGDWRARSLVMPRGFGLMGRLVFGLSKPRQPILGTELSGDVVAIGRDVTRFKVGDAVFAFAGAAMGCHAEYKCMRQDGALALKPEGLTYDEAAALSFGGTTALSFFRRAKLQRGESVLVNGASGGVGTAAVQLATHFGAQVTGVCSAGNAALVRSLGATHVLDYAREDFTKNGERYDVIVDTAGTAPFSRSAASLNPGGRCLLVLGGLPDLLRLPWQQLRSGKTIIAGPAAVRAADLQFLADLAAAGEFTPVIDRRYAFADTADAHRHVDSGHKRGNVVVTFPE